MPCGFESKSQLIKQTTWRSLIWHKIFMCANMLQDKVHSYLDTKTYEFVVNIFFNTCCPLLLCKMLSYCTVTLIITLPLRWCFIAIGHTVLNPGGIIISVSHVESWKHLKVKWVHSKIRKLQFYSVSLYRRETSRSLNGICWQHKACLKTPMTRVHLNGEPGINMDKEKIEVIMLWPWVRENQQVSASKLQ